METGKEFKEQEVSEKASEVFNKPMHGEWFRNVGEDTSERTFDWLKKGYLDKRTEGYIFSAQEQALQTNWLKSRITGGEVDRMCRKCKQYPEKVSHIVSGCSKLASSAYRKRHDRMGLRVYWEICKNYGIKCSEKWYQETPDSVRISNCGKFEIWWDRKVETPKPLEANRPDVVLIDQEKKHWTMIDFSVPNDANVEKKEQEKIEKYTPLAHEIRKMNHVSVKTVVVVVVVFVFFWWLFFYDIFYFLFINNRSWAGPTIVLYGTKYFYIPVNLFLYLFLVCKSMSYTRVPSLFVPGQEPGLGPISTNE